MERRQTGCFARSPEAREGGTWNTDQGKDFAPAIRIESANQIQKGAQADKAPALSVAGSYAQNSGTRSIGGGFSNKALQARCDANRATVQVFENKSVETTWKNGTGQSGSGLFPDYRVHSWIS